MNILLIAAVVFVLGSLGGVANAVVTQSTLALPSRKGNIFQPGILGNMFVGGIAAVVSWGLYGAFAPYPVLGEAALALPTPVLTIGQLVGAIVIGFGGAKVLQDESDKRTLKTAAVRATEFIEGSSNLSTAKVEDATPVELLEIIEDMVSSEETDVGSRNSV